MSQTAMRLTLWFILILAFSVGMCCAIAMKTYVFEAKPLTAQNLEPTTKILVAKRTIPAGIEISADSVIFQEVAVSEVPRGSLTSFDQVFRREPAYPIPLGCPICEDLLAPVAEAETEAAFLPAGSQFVTLDVARIRQDGKVFSSNEPVAEVLAAEQRIDIRVVPRDEVQGSLAEKKNEVLRTFVAEDYRSSGELLLENVPIHQVQKKSIGGQSATPQVMLVLDKSEAALLTAAAKKGQIRILLNAGSNATLGAEPEDSVDTPQIGDAIGVEMAISSPQNKPAQNEPTQNEPAQKESAQHEPTVSIPVETDPFDVPLVSELSAPPAEESVPAEAVASALPETKPTGTVDIETVEKTAPEPKTPDIFATADSNENIGKDLPQAPLPELAYSTLKAEKPENKQDNTDKSSPAEDSDAPVVPELVMKEKIRNDHPVIAFGSPMVRVISERATEQKPVQSAQSTSKEPLQSEKKEQVSLIPPYSETVSEHPRISRSLPFQTPGAVVPAKELPGEVVQWSETNAVPLEPLAAVPVPNSSVPFSSVPLSPMPVSLKPTISPIPNIVQEKAPSYSPFERRIYTVSPAGELEESYDVLPAPALLQEIAE